MMHPAADPESSATPPDPESYSDEVRQEIAITLGQRPPGEWAQLALCPGRFGCPYATAEEATAGVGVNVDIQFEALEKNPSISLQVSC